MAFVKTDKRIRKKYRAVADLLGPVGEEALRSLCEDLYEAGHDDGYEQRRYDETEPPFEV